MMIVEQSVGCEFAGETEVLGVNLPQYRGGKPATNHLSCGTAQTVHGYYHILSHICTEIVN
jgi:hypothetical protein